MKAHTLWTVNEYGYAIGRGYLSTIAGETHLLVDARGHFAAHFLGQTMCLPGFTGVYRMERRGS